MLKLNGDTNMLEAVLEILLCVLLLLFKGRITNTEEFPLITFADSHNLPNHDLLPMPELERPSVWFNLGIAEL